MVRCTMEFNADACMIGCPRTRTSDHAALAPAISGAHAAAAHLLLAEMRLAIKEAGLSKEKRFDAIVELVRRYDAAELKPQSIAARQRVILVAEIKQIRPLLKGLVGLDLHGEESSHWPALIAAWKDAYQQGKDGLTTAMAPPKSPTWEQLLADPNANERNTAEVQLLW